MSRTTVVPRLASRNRLALIVGIFLALIAGLFGGVLLGVSAQDYSSYTARTHATVTDVRAHDSGFSKTQTTRYRYYVDFEAAGRSFTHQTLNGVVAGRPQVGDTVVLVYPPGRPDRAVTELTTSASSRAVELWIGIGLLVAAVATLAAITVSVIRKRRAAALTRFDAAS